MLVVKSELDNPCSAAPSRAANATRVWITRLVIVRDPQLPGQETPPEQYVSHGAANGDINALAHVDPAQGVTDI